MGRIIDSHAHIYLEQFDADRDEMIERAVEKGVSKILMPNVDGETIDAMLESELRYANICIPMMGLHPCSIGKNFEKDLYVVEEWLDKRASVAVGEIGTDLYWDRTYWEQQQEALCIQMDWAKNYKLPVVLHCRDSIEETIMLVEGKGRGEMNGVFHCFGGTVSQAEKIIEMDYMIGIGGVATFKNGRLDEVLKEVPMGKIILETDSPYLAPVPHRGTRNEPAYLLLVAEKIARIKDVSVEEVIETTHDNCLKLFGKI